jgi:predicted ATPase
MNTYKFLLKDYKAIKEANIDLNGITVLAGENGSGKSTITRWFYYLIEVIAKYDKFAYEDLCDDIFTILREYNLIFRSIIFEDTGISSLITKWRNQTKTLDSSSLDDLMKVVNGAKEIIVRVADFIEQNSNEEKMNSHITRSMKSLGIENIDRFDKELYILQTNSKIDKVFQNYRSNIAARHIDNIYRYIRQDYDDKLKHPNEIQFFEDNIPILEDKTIGFLFGIQRAIYIDTPMSIVNKSINNGLWWKLLELLLKPSNNVISMQTKKMLLRIQKLIHGNIKLNEDDFDDEMHFIREDELEISLSEAATGIKSFACIIRLLENGYLDKNTLLIIDEPEAHLHPQWIVEYARILVLLSKELGVRILIASHNPDMVAAIQAIGEKEGLKERITFYQAIPTDTMYQYEYKNLGFEVTEIFKSFNIALSRIQDYGRIDN